MEETLEALRSIVKQKGYAETAVLLGHKNTHNLYRWLRESRIPDNQVAGVKAILRNQGYMR